MNSIGIQYNARLQLMVRKVKADIDAHLLPALRALEAQYVADAWPDTIASIMAFLLGKRGSIATNPGARSIANEFVTTAVRRSDRQPLRIGGGSGGRIGAGTSVAINAYSGNQDLEDYLRASALQNAQLIKSIPTEYLDRVQTMVFANMRAGLRPSAIEANLVDQFGITKRRAKLIARDQTNKIQGDLNEKKQRGAGFEFFQWVDVHDQRVRHRHKEIAQAVTEYGKGVYRWDELPKNDKGQPIKPGQDIQCRCIAKPVPTSKVRRFRQQGL